MGIATKKCIAIYCDKQGRIAIRITIYWDSVNSLDHEIQKGYILGVSSPHKLENFHWYHELGPLLGFTKQVFASLRSGAVLYNGHFLCAPYNHAEIFKIRHCLAVFDAGLFT